MTIKQGSPITFGKVRVILHTFPAVPRLGHPIPLSRRKDPPGEQMLSGTELHLCLPPRPHAIKHVSWWWPSLTAQPGRVHMSQGQRGCSRAMGVGSVWSATKDGHRITCIFSKIRCKGPNFFMTFKYSVTHSQSAVIPTGTQALLFIIWVTHQRKHLNNDFKPSLCFCFYLNIKFYILM